MKILNLYGVGLAAQGQTVLMSGHPFLGEAPDREKRLSDFWNEAKSTDRALKFVLLFNPPATARAVGDILSLPRLEARLGQGFEAGLIRANFQRRCLCQVFTLGSSGACILPVPANGRDYSEGARKQTLRRKVRAAEKAGVTCRSVEDLGEQREILHMLHEALETKSNARYRVRNPDHSALVGAAPWTVAFAENGEPLAVAVTPRDGEWAVLYLFVSLGETQLHSDARYLLAKAVVERLSEEGVRHLADTLSPSELSNGLRHFQRMIGFRIQRVRVA